jgi:hypothetical protein
VHRAVGFDSEQVGGQNEVEDTQMLAQVWLDNHVLDLVDDTEQVGLRHVKSGKNETPFWQIAMQSPDGRQTRDRR